MADFDYDDHSSYDVDWNADEQEDETIVSVAAFDAAVPSPGTVSPLAAHTVFLPEPTPDPMGAFRRRLFKRPAAVYPLETMLARMRSLITQLSSVICVTEDEAFFFLKDAKWRVDVATERYTDDPSAVRTRLGVSAGPDPPAPPREGGTVHCSVMWEDVPYCDADACACGHWFSCDAWRGHVSSAMSQPRSAFATRCMHEGCNELVRPRMFVKYLPAEAAEVYREYQARMLAEEHPLNVWCPGRGCRFVTVREPGVHAEVACPAGHTFCTKCRAEPHLPASCEQMQAWLKREGDDGQTATWLLAHTKPCPKCRKAIEKNQGCNHMTCQPLAGGCGHHFCWMCLNPWESHRDFYNCSGVPPATLYSAKDASAAAAELQRYVHMYERFSNEKRAGKLADTTMRTQVAARKKSLQETLMLSSADLAFFDDATDIIVRGRQVTACSIVHRWHVTNPTYAALFDDSQQQLNSHLELLHELVELAKLDEIINYEVDASVVVPDIPEVQRGFYRWRMRVMDLTTSTERFLMQLLDAVQDGFLAAATVPLNDVEATDSTGVASKRPRASADQPAASQRQVPKKRKRKRARAAVKTEL